MSGYQATPWKEPEYARVMCWWLIVPLMHGRTPSSLLWSTVNLRSNGFSPLVIRCSSCLKTHFTTLFPSPRRWSFVYGAVPHMLFISCDEEEHPCLS